MLTPSLIEGNYMDPQQQAFIEVLQKSVSVIDSARTEQGWTAGAVALVLVLCILALGWMVRRLCIQVDELQMWRANVLQGQIESTVKALDLSSDGLTCFARKFDEHTAAIKDNTHAVHALRDAIRKAPCARALE